MRRLIQREKLGTFGDAGVFSFDFWKIITTGGGGMILTRDEDIYRRCVHYSDHGHEVYRQNEDLGERPLIGLNFRMEELEGAMGLAQLAKLDNIVSTMRKNSGYVMDNIKDIDLFIPRQIPDPEGDIGNGVTIIFNSAAIAEDFYKKIKVENIEVEWLKESGWHNYVNWKQLLKKKTLDKSGCPFTCPRYEGKVEYYEGMCPKTDDILARTVTIGYNRLLKTDKKELDNIIQVIRGILKK